LGAFIARKDPGWPDVVDAADRLRQSLGVSQSLWAEACGVLGRPLAAVAIAVVSTKPRQHFKRGAAGYFAAMIKRAEQGQLHLDRSLWKLRRGLSPGAGGRS
jgi:replication initiation protein RepC